GCCDHMKSIIEWVLRHAACDQAGNMRHVCHQQRTDLLADRGKFLIIKFSGVSTETSQNNLWFVFTRKYSQMLVVDLTRFSVLHLVTNKVIQFCTARHRCTVRQMPSMAQIHRQNRITRLEPRTID